MLSPKVARSTESCKLHWAKKSVCVACPATRSGSSARMAAPLLRDFLCPITLTPMQDPVVTADGTEALPSQPLLSHFPQPSHTHAAFPIDLPLSLHGKGMGRKGACGAPPHCWGGVSVEPTICFTSTTHQSTQPRKRDALKRSACGHPGHTQCSMPRCTLHPLLNDVVRSLPLPSPIHRVPHAQPRPRVSTPCAHTYDQMVQQQEVALSHPSLTPVARTQHSDTRFNGKHESRREGCSGVCMHVSIRALE
jgi:hypothetical protein